MEEGRCWNGFFHPRFEFLKPAGIKVVDRHIDHRQGDLCRDRLSLEISGDHFKCDFRTGSHRLLWVYHLQQKLFPDTENHIRFVQSGVIHHRQRNGGFRVHRGEHIEADAIAT